MSFQREEASLKKTELKLKNIFIVSNKFKFSMEESPIRKFM